ncbi:MAG: hypothetical protein ACRC50_12700 [Gaiella sp.]
MCSLCGVMSKEHWATQGEDRRAALLRARALERVLDHHGLTVQAWGVGTLVVRDRKGGTAVVDDLGALWVAAERLAGRPLDPLDPALVRALSA